MNRNEPLGLPRGSVRSLIALILVLTLAYEVISGAALNETFAAIVATVIAFYFGTRPTTPQPTVTGIQIREGNQ